MVASQKILLVDDERDILDILEYNLKKAGYEVHTAENGYQGLIKAIELRPKLIILDYMMPRMDVLTTCLKVREEPTLKDTVIALLSARSESEIVRKAFKFGANDYIAKPISPSLFVDKVKHLMAG
ncbi:MAG: PleD family two-component system response regulator [Flavobacteriales bacterium]